MESNFSQEVAFGSPWLLLESLGDLVLLTKGLKDVFILLNHKKL